MGKEHQRINAGHGKPPVIKPQSEPLDPKIEEIMKELRTKYRAIKGNANASNEEIADYIASAFQLATLPAATNPDDESFEGFYVHGSEMASLTNWALHSLRNTLFANDLRTPFVSNLVREDGIYRIATTVKIDQKKHEDLCKKFGMAVGGRAEKLRKTTNPQPHDYAQTSMNSGDAIFFSTLLQCDTLLQEASENHGTATLTPYPALLLRHTIDRLYPGAFTGKPREALARKGELDIDTNLKLLSDFTRARNLRAHGERYYYAYFRRQAEACKVPPNQEFQPIRDFLQATSCLVMDGNTLHFHDSNPDSTAALVRRLIGNTHPAESLRIDEERNVIELSAEAAGAYKAAMERVNEFVQRSNLPKEDPKKIKHTDLARELARPDDGVTLFSTGKWAAQAVARR